MIALSLFLSLSLSLTLFLSLRQSQDTATREMSDLVIVQLAAESWGCGGSGGHCGMYVHKVKSSGKRAEDDG